MTRAWLATGKYGDVVNVLPILHAESQRTGEKQILVIAKAYAPILEGCSYIEPHILDLSCQEHAEALKRAKAQYDEVVSLQTHGKDFPIQPRTPSFQLDQWQRGGYLEKFGTLPLVFDQRDAKREAKLLKGIKKPFILLADGAESRPHPHIHEIAEVIRKTQPDHNLVLLSTIRAERVFDLLALYDKASALVTIDTMHLHLSAASKCPVLAFAGDMPSNWHGSFWSPRFHFYARYSQWRERQHDFTQALERAVKGEPTRNLNGHLTKEVLSRWLEEKMVPPLSMQRTIKPLRALNTPANGYNPSIIDSKLGGITSSCRVHMNRSPKTVLHIHRGLDWKPLRVGDPGFSYEDMRLFQFRGALWGSYVVSTIPASPPTCIIAYGQLEEHADHWTVLTEYRPQFIGNDFSGMSKNWVFFEQGGKLYAIFASIPGHTVIELDGEKVVQVFKSGTPTWNWGEIRGGCTIPHGGRLLRFFHSRLEAPVARYYVGAMLMEAQPPFKIVAISKEPILYGSEWETSHAFHYKKNVVFPAGVAKDGSDFLLAVGVNDTASVMVKLGEGELNL